MTIIGLVIGFISITFYDSIISTMLHDRHELEQESIGFVFLVPLSSFLLGVPLLNLFMHWFHRRHTILIGLIFATLWNILTGPS
jgi:MFS family permease